MQDVARVLERAPAPMKVAKIAEALGLKANSAKAKRFPGELRKLLAEQPESPGIYVWPKYGPSQVYCGRPLRSCVEEALLRVLDTEPLTVAKAVEAVRKALRLLSEKPALTEVRAAARELASSKRIVAIFLNRQTAKYLSHAWMARQIPPAARDTPIAAMIPAIVERLQTARGNYVRVDRLRNAPELRGLVDRAVIQLADAGELVLARYDGPRPDEDKEWLYVKDNDGERFIGVALPRFQEDEA